MEREERKQFCQKLRNLRTVKDTSAVGLSVVQESLEASENPSYRALSLSIELMKKQELTNIDSLEHIERIVCSTML